MLEKISPIYFKSIVTIVCILLIHIFATPTYFALSPACKPCPDGCCDMQAKINRKDNLLQSVSAKYPPSDHMAKTEFRLTPPLIFKFLHINTKYGAYIFQVIAGFVFFFLIIHILSSFITDRTTITLFTLSFAFIYPGYSFIAEMEGFFDSFAFLFILIAMIDLPIIIIGLALFLAFWTDERAIFSSLLVLFWWQFKQYESKKASFFMPSKQAITLILVLFLYIFLRWYLVTYYGFVNQLQGTGTLKYTINYAGLALWQAYEGFWIIIALSIYGFWNKKQYLILILFISSNFIIFYIGMNVMDITRSIAYIFPAIFIAIYTIKNNIDAKQLKQVVAISLLFCFIFPAYSIIVGKQPHSYNPIYMRMAKKILNIP